MNIIDQYKDFLDQKGIRYMDVSGLDVYVPTDHLPSNSVRVSLWYDSIILYCWIGSIQLDEGEEQDEIITKMNEAVPDLNIWYDMPDIVGYIKMRDATVEELHEKLLWAAQMIDNAYVTAQNLNDGKLTRH